LRLQECMCCEGLGLKLSLTYKVWLVCSALATGTGRWRGCTAQPWDHPLTHRGAHGCLSRFCHSAARACHARAAPALHSPHHVGRETRPPPSQLPTHTVARPDPPLVRSQAERSQAVALPHSLPRSLAKPPGTHAPAAAWRARAQAAPSRRLGSGRAWRKQGAKTRPEKTRREERGVGAAEGPARVHVTRQGHRRHGQGKRAPTQDPPALDDHSESSRVSAW
jgi:hypothetical protein